MPKIRKELLVVGDRILIEPQEGEGRTESGLVLPATAINEQQVQRGRVVKVGPGIPVADPMDHDEPWKKRKEHVARYVPLQAKPGDVAIYLKKAAIEISYEGCKYLIVPNNAVLLLAREEIDLSEAFPGIADL